MVCDPPSILKAAIARYLTSLKKKYIKKGLHMFDWNYNGSRF